MTDRYLRPLMTCTSVGANEYATKVAYLMKQIGVILACRPENLWLKVVLSLSLSLPGGMDVTGESEKSRNRSLGDKTS
jgi:hypothetical protein